jgi:uncharacterized membrane protein (DUF106 family)
MTDGSLRRLVADRETAPALAVVYETAETGDGTVRWADVREEIDGEQWGRLLGEGVLLSVGDRFVIDDPTAVREALAERDGTDLDSSDSSADAADTENAAEVTGETAIGTEGTDDTGWTTADKLAGVVALALVGGYQVPAIRDTVAGTVDLVLGPAVGTIPFPALLFGLAAAVAITSTGVRRRLGGGAMDEVQERTQSLREDLRAARKREDEATIERLENEQREVITEQLGAMKYQFRPLVWTMLLTIPVFMWLTWLTVDPTGAIASASTFIPVLGEIVWTARVLGPVQAWIVWYGLCSLLASLATRRTLDRLGVGAGA